MAVDVQVTIDGRRQECAAGTSILAAATQAGIDIPTLCHDDRVGPVGECRLCLVRVADRDRLVPACTTQVEAAMVIETHTPELEIHRASVLRMLARRYPASAVEQFPDKPFHKLLRAYGIDALSAPVSDDRCDYSHPYIAVDMSRCIDCSRCVRICSDLQGQRVWHVRDRGIDTRIEPDGPTLRESSCVSCGACVDTCPTGALEDAGAFGAAQPSAWTRTTCPYCGVGCEMNVGTRDGRIVAIRPVRDAPVSKGHLCVKGRYAFAFVHAGDRIDRPMIRDGESWRFASWPEARSVVVERLAKILEEHGPDSIGILGSARATNEDNYVIEKFARTVIGTNNVDSCARVCHAPSAAALKAVFGAGLATNSFDDIERARVILVCGANATESHPVLGARIRRAARRGAQLIVIDPRRTELAAAATCHLALRPGTDVPLLNAMARVIVTDGLCADGFVNRRVDRIEEFRRFIAQWTPERAAGICGVDADAIRTAARLYATGHPAISFHGLGLTEHVQGTGGVMALIDLALLTGNIGTAGAGVNPLRGQNNVQGAAHMGCDPLTLPGSTPLESGRQAFEARWRTPLPRTRGMNLMEMMEAARHGWLKALWAIGYDILLTNPNTEQTAEALRSMNLVVVQDLFLTETAREFGTVFLPACSTFEKEGTFMNAERRIQRVRAALPPAGESTADWQIVSDVARAMGHGGFAFTSAEAIWDEVRSLCSGARGMTYARLERAGLQWPCSGEDDPGTAILHGEYVAGGSRAALQCVDYRPTPEGATPEYPFLLMTGRSLYQFNAGTMTRRTPNALLKPDDVLDISGADAATLGLRQGDRVRVVSRYGATVLPVRVAPEVSRGEAFATFQTTESRVNALTGSNRDNVTGTPEYKVTAIRIEPLPVV